MRTAFTNAVYSVEGFSPSTFDFVQYAFDGAEHACIDLRVYWQVGFQAHQISRVDRQLVEQFATWNTRRLDDLDLVFSWADGVYLGADPDDERGCSWRSWAPIATLTSNLSLYKRP